MNDAEIIEWIAEHLSVLRVTPYGDLEIKYIDDTVHEKEHYETNHVIQPPAELLKDTIAKLAGK